MVSSSPLYASHGSPEFTFPRRSTPRQRKKNANKKPFFSVKLTYKAPFTTFPCVRTEKNVVNEPLERPVVRPVNDVEKYTGEWRV